MCLFQSATVWYRDNFAPLVPAKKTKQKNNNTHTHTDTPDIALTSPVLYFCCGCVTFEITSAQPAAFSWNEVPEGVC